MKIARIYLRVSTDEQDLTRQAEIEHINLTGIYDWRSEPQPKGTFRPLRIAKEKFMAAV